MDVQDGVREGIQEPLTDQAHEPRETYEPHLPCREFCRQRQVEGLTIRERAMAERERLDPRGASPINAGRAVAVRNDDGNPGAQRSGFDGIDQGLKVAAATGDQDTDIRNFLRSIIAQCNGPLLRRPRSYRS